MRRPLGAAEYSQMAVAALPCQVDQYRITAQQARALEFSRTAARSQLKTQALIITPRDKMVVGLLLPTLGFSFPQLAFQITQPTMVMEVEFIRTVAL